MLLVVFLHYHVIRSVWQDIDSDTSFSLCGGWSRLISICSLILMALLDCLITERFSRTAWL